MKGVRYCTILSLGLLLAMAPVVGLQAQPAGVSGQADGLEPDARRQNELQDRANRLIQQGQFQQALLILESLSGRRSDAGPLLQMLDLQVRLNDEEGARRSMEELAARLPTGGRLVSYPDFQIAGALAGAHYRLGRPARAADLWKQMKEQASSEPLALAVFHSYRQVRLIDEAHAWATEQRRRASSVDLWALELAQMHEESGHPREAFDELALWGCRQQAAGRVLEPRLLALAEGATDRRVLIEHMLKRVEGGKETCPALGEAVLGILVQHRWVGKAVPLAWRLDTDGTGAAPFRLAGDLVRDGSHKAALALLEDLARRGRHPATQPEFLLLKAECLAALDKPEEALALFRQAAGTGGAKGLPAAMRAADLLHRPLGHLPEAARELEGVLARQPSHREAGRRLVLLLGCQGEHERARDALRRLRAQQGPGAEGASELDWLGLSLDWWAGRLSACREGLGAFLKTSTRQVVFNDAIELMDLMAFATTDSAKVVEAARADRLAYAGRWREALDLLHATAESSTGRLAEWLDWRACLLATREMPPTEARAEYARYRLRQPESVRLDRLAWMELEAMEGEGQPVDSLRAQALDLLRTWPQSLLQDAVRRRLRGWEGGSPGEGAAVSPAEPVGDGRPR
ncbi:MAG: hypothetical protein Q8O14_08290 [bacterium]|jgi:tetratricopeptide (TPR) repeat protein|nr:hypothetical protein [bacterium]